MTIAIPTREGFTLEGLLDGPAGTTEAASPASGAQRVPGDGKVPRAGVVVCHPHPAFGGTLSTPLVVALAEAIAARGLVALRFNFRGIGGSGGQARGGAVEHEDVRAAFDWLRERGVERIALCGYSFGALMAVRALAGGLPADAFAAIGFPSTIVGDHPDRIADVRRGFAACPTLLLSGTRDQFSELDRLRAFCADAPAAALDVLEGRGHFFTGDDERAVVARAIDFLAARLSG